MSENYLNETGLSYFWSKIKAWATAAFAAISHVHASSGVTSMAGYSKAGAGSAIAVGDSLNAAIGKLEYKVDAYDDSNYVHRTGDETVGGTKTYVPTGGSGSSITWAHNYLKNQYFDRTVDDDKVHYLSFLFCDSVHDASDALSDGRVGGIGAVVNMTNGYAYTNIACREYMKKSGLTAQTAELRVGVDANGNQFSFAPMTRSVGVTNNDIITYGYLNSAISISGKKLFTASELFMAHAVSKGTVPSSSSYRGIYFLTGNGNLDDKTGHLYRFGRLESCVNSNGDVTVCMSAYANVANSTASSSVWAIWDSTNGIAAATAPSTSAARTDGTDIVTRDWIPNDSRIVHTTGSETVAGAKIFTSKILNTSGNWKAFDHQKSSLDKDTRPASGSSTVWSGIAALSGSGNKDIVIFCHSVNYTESAAIWSVRKFSSTDTSAGVQVVASNGSSAKAFAPQTNNELSLGDSGRRWTQLYAASSSINTSDERVKRFIDSVPDDVLDAWLDAGFFQFQFADAVSEKGEASARFHIGMVAQRIDAAFKAHGLDASRYGLFCHDEWDAVSEYRNENGELVQPAVSAGDLYSLRYEEVLCLEAACMRRENARLKERLAALEERLAALEMK